jgi:uncharacterized membrane protein
MNHNSTQKTDSKYPLFLVSTSTIGLTASFWQASERIQMLKYPTRELSCNLNPLVDCSNVLGNKLAAVFGPPNAFIGMVVFTLLLAFGIGRFGKGTWTPLVRNLVLGLSELIMLFSLWFFSVSVYSIGSICIFCIFIWSVSIPIGIYGIKDYLQSSNITTTYAAALKRIFEKHPLELLIGTYALMLFLYFSHFRAYYF